MVRMPQKKKNNCRSGVLIKVTASALATGIALLAVQSSHAQEESDAWQELRSIESLLRTDAAAAVSRARELRLRTADATDQRLRARVFQVECSAQYRAGENGLATVACDNALSIADPLDDAALSARILNTRATVSYSAGRNSEAFADYERASEFAELSGDLELVSPIQSNLAVIVRNTGAISDSIPYAQRALEAARAIDDHSRIALVLLNLSDTYLDLGKLQLAQDHVERAIEHADQGDIMRWRYAGRLQQAYLLLEQDRSEDALIALNELASSEELRGEPRQIARLRILFANVYKSTGDMERAMAAAEESLEIVESLGDRWRAAMWSIELARLHRLNGNPAEALRIIESVEGFARPGSRDRLLQAALAEKAEILLAGQQPDEAFFALKESRDIESRMTSHEAEEQLWLMSTSEAAQASRQTIADLQQRSLVAERQADLNLRARNALLLAIALALSAGLCWRHRSVRQAPGQKEGDLRLETNLSAEEQVDHQQNLDALGRLTGGIAHDFGNLLNVVNGALELLKTNAGKRLEKQHLRLIEEALSAGTAGAAISNQLLSFSRKKPLKPERIDCVQHIRDVSSLLRRAVGEQTVVRIELPDGRIPVDLDRGQFTTALLNLVINARESGAGEIDIAVDHDWGGAEEVGKTPDLVSGLCVSISVRDNGSGMTAEEVQQAFEPFYSARNTSKGAGLGLSMVYGFARQSGGVATIDSSTQTGTTVKLLLPLAERFADQSAMASSTINSDSLGRALVIEDRDDIRVVACAYLESLGFEAVGAESADKAVTMIDLGFEPCFLFVDIVMPGSMDGREFAAWAHEKLPDAEILLTTDYSDAKNHADCSFPILHKPYRMEELSAYLSARFGNAHGEQRDV